MTGFKAAAPDLQTALKRFDLRGMQQLYLPLEDRSKPLMIRVRGRLNLTAPKLVMPDAGMQVLADDLKGGLNLKLGPSDKHEGRLLLRQNGALTLNRAALQVDTYTLKGDSLGWDGKLQLLGAGGQDNKPPHFSAEGALKSTPSLLALPTLTMESRHDLLLFKGQVVWDPRKPETAPQLKGLITASGLQLLSPHQKLQLMATDKAQLTGFRVDGLSSVSANTLQLEAFKTLQIMPAAEAGP